jgi:hypothetical protein
LTSFKTSNQRSPVSPEINNGTMAATLAGMCTGLRAIGFTITSSSEIVDEQGYNYLTALAKLTDQTCTNLITLIRRPGGMIPNPVVPAAGAPLLPEIANPGIKVGHLT